MNLTFTETKTVTVDYELKDVIRYTQRQAGEKSGQCMKVLSGLIKTYRYDLFDTFGPYRVILNGYGEFKHVENLETGEITDARTIYRKLKKIERNEH